MLVDQQIVVTNSQI